MIKFSKARKFVAWDVPENPFKDKEGRELSNEELEYYLLGSSNTPPHVIKCMGWVITIEGLTRFVAKTEHHGWYELKAPSKEFALRMLDEVSFGEVYYIAELNDTHRVEV